MKNYTIEEVRFIMRTEMIAGQWSAKNLPKLLRDRGWPRIAIIVDGGVLDHNPYAKDIIALLKKDMDETVLVRCDMASPLDRSIVLPPPMPTTQSRNLPSIFSFI